MRLSDFVGAAVRAPRPSSPSKTPTAAASTAATSRPSSRSPAPPIAQWVTRLLVCAFECGISIDSLSDYTGSQNITADNDRFLRKWWETASFGAGLWAPCSKGGNFTRWFGNNEYAIDWSDKAREFYRNSSTSNLLKKQHWFKEGIAYSDIASGKSPFPLFTCTGYL